MNKQLENMSVDALLILFPENHSLYKDSRSWIIKDDNGEWLCDQEHNETFKDFLIRFLFTIPYHVEENLWRTWNTLQL